MAFKFEKLSVLVVEDTPPMLKLIVSVLDTLGVGTVFASDGEENPYEAFRRRNPDIVISDWQMRGMTGLELTKRIRTDSMSPNRVAPVILVTGYSALERVAEARDAGVTEFLVKPFTASELAKRIAHAINKPRDFVEHPSYFGPDRRRATPADYKGPYRRITDKDRLS